MVDLWDVLEGCVVAVEEFELQAAQESAAAKPAGPRRLEGVADCSDAGAFCDVQEGACDGGEDVGVLVGVEVSDIDAGTLELLDLGDCLALDVVLANLAAE